MPKTYAYGKAFEHFILLEIHRLNIYLEQDLRCSYLRTKDDAEIDLIVEKPEGGVVLVEIKSTDQVDDRDTRTLERFLPEFTNARALCLTCDPRAKMFAL